MSWNDKPNYEINKAVAGHQGFGLDNGYGFYDSDGNLVCYDVISPVGGEPEIIEVRINYCTNIQDA